MKTKESKKRTIKKTKRKQKIKLKRKNKIDIDLNNKTRDQLDTYSKILDVSINKSFSKIIILK